MITPCVRGSHRPPPRWGRLRRPLRLSLRLSVGLTLLTGGAGCLKTSQYTPTQPGRAYLYVEQSQLAVYKDHSVYPKHLLGQPFRCDDATARQAVVAGEALIASERNFQIAGVLNGLSFILPPLLVASPYFIVRGSQEMHAGTAALVDAVNMHNDADACRGGAAMAGGGPR